MVEQTLGGLSFVGLVDGEVESGEVIASTEGFGVGVAAGLAVAVEGLFEELAGSVDFRFLISDLRWGGLSCE